MLFQTRHVRRVALLMLSGLGFAGLASGTALAQGAPPPPAVTVATPLSQKITEWDEYTGRFEAVETVEVRARVSGFIETVNFRDGQMVKKDDLLYVIDKRPFALAVDSARAEVDRVTATVALTSADVERAEALVRTNALTQRDSDTRKAALKQAQAQLDSARAALRTAQLNFDWTEVRAPLTGRISDTKIDAGNLIAGGASASPTLLTTIVSTDPIRFVFDASEADYLRYARLNASGDRTSSREVANPVRVRLADEAEWTHDGKMDFVDNQLNPRSGTIRGRAILANSDGFLTPGTFGRLRLFAGEHEALLIPDAAIVADQTNKIVMEVGPDNQVVPKPVTLGPIVDGLRVVRGGIGKDDRIIIGGLANPFVRPGVKVDPKPGEIKTAAAR
jgi:RND family efflux transporter MFP subunit